MTANQIVMIALGALGVVSWWFITRTLTKIDANQTTLFEKHGDHEKRLSHIEGVCATRHE